MQITPSEAEFAKLARQGNVIPVYGEVLADLETPVSAFLKLDDGRFSYLLESVEGTEKVARFSGGLVGYLGYNVVRFLERLPAHQLDDLRIPDLMLMLTDTMAIFDHAQHKLLLVANAQTQHTTPHAAYRWAVRQIETMAARLKGPLPNTVRRRTGRRTNMKLESGALGIG